jgi:two-component system, chemotaxis family, sensor kinase CheA
MQRVFGKKQSDLSENDFTPLVELAEEIAERNGKQVNVVLQIEKDLEQLPNRLREPVLQMMTQFVRNAVLHGIERPIDRLAARKHPIGNVDICAQHRPDYQDKLIFAVRDDGRGINYPALRRRAVQFGYASVSTIASWKSQQLDTLLFETGFTTMDRPTIDGGRGVGLDAVKDLTTKMGGTVSVFSAPGQFCEFRLEIPIA